MGKKEDFHWGPIANADGVALGIKVGIVPPLLQPLANIQVTQYWYLIATLGTQAPLDEKTIDELHFPVKALHTSSIIELANSDTMSLIRYPAIPGPGAEKLIAANKAWNRSEVKVGDLTNDKSAEIQAALAGNKPTALKAYENMANLSFVYGDTPGFLGLPPIC